MNITTKTGTYEATPGILELATARFGSVERLLGKAKDTALLEIELGLSSESHKSGQIYRAEANLDVDGKLYRATAESDSMERAIDKAAGELNREVKSASGRTKRLIRSTGARVKSWLRFGR